MKQDTFSRNCPTCNKELSYKTQTNRDKAEKKQQRCWSCASSGRLAWNKGVARTSNEKRAISDGIKSRDWQKSSYWRKRRSDQNKGRKLNEVHKRKISIAHKRRNSKIPRMRSPNFNVSACAIFDEMNEELNWNGQHALNGGELYLQELGYWVDYYELTLNIVIEYDEAHHRYPANIEKDKKREEVITEYLDCRFYRIEEGKDWREVFNHYLL